MTVKVPAARSGKVRDASVQDRGIDNGREYDLGGRRETDSSDDSEDDPPCAVCLEKDPWEDDPMIFCEGPCSMCVHIKCYGLKEVPKGDFYCEGCKEVKRIRAANAVVSMARGGKTLKESDRIGKKPRCVLCRVSSGMMKRSLCGRWTHLLCVLFTGNRRICFEYL